MTECDGSRRQTNLRQTNSRQTGRSPVKPDCRAPEFKAWLQVPDKPMEGTETLSPHVAHFYLTDCPSSPILHTPTLPQLVFFHYRSHL